MVDIKEIDSLFDEESRKRTEQKQISTISKHTRRVQLAKLILPSFAAVLIALLLILPSLQNSGKEFLLDVTLPKKGELEKLHVEKTVLNITDKKNRVNNFTADNIDETELSYTTRDSEGRRQKHIVFQGVIAQIDFKKPFKGHTIIRTRGLFNSKTYEEVKLEDPEFSKMYFVDANDQIEARYILTTSFMERFKNIKNSFSASQMEASIQDSKILIAIHTTKDLFKLGDLNRPVNDTKQFTELLNEFVSILAIVDELKLNQNIGL